MDRDTLAIVQEAAREAQEVGGEVFVGPDGKTYRGVFRAPNDFELAAAGLEMTTHGFGDRVQLFLVVTRDQFRQPPYDWRRRDIRRTSTAPQINTVHSISTDDPIFFGFVLSATQSPAAG